MKDTTTGLLMSPVSEKTCKASKGFVCKVSLDAGDMHMHDYHDRDDDGRMMT